MVLAQKKKAKIIKKLRVTRLPYLPFALGIETGNICNLKCPLCPTGAGEAGLTKGFMGFSLFKNVFEQLKGSLLSINLYSWGEPLLNKDLILMIKYAKRMKPSARITTSTNLNIHSDELLSELISSCIDEIIVSCDGASEETYAKYRVGGDFNLVISNLEFLAAKKKELGKNTLLVWNFLVFRHNEHEIELARKMARKIGVDFRLGLMRTTMKDEILKNHEESIRKDKEWIPDNPEYSAYDKEKCVTKKIIKTCRKPWQEISVNWDGKVFPCCAVYGDEYSFGSLKNSALKSLWNNAAYIEARREIINKRRKAKTICGVCRDNCFMHM